MFPATRIAARLTVGATTLVLATFLGTHSPGVAIAVSTFTVDSAADQGDYTPGDGVCATGPNGPCTLRAAIEEANASAGRDTIAFDLHRSRRIAPTSPLPPLTDPAVIDGTTQPGFLSKPLIELDGSLAGNATGLLLSAGDSVVRGLIINGFAGVGIGVVSDNNVIQGNFVGMDASGRYDRGNKLDGLVVSGEGNLIGGTEPRAGNVISGNDKAGILLAPGGTRVQGNLIGTDFKGDKRIGNSFSGIQACGCYPGGFPPGLPLIGGSEPGAGNVISGNAVDGINGEGVIVAIGNKIGTNVDGNKPLGNGRAGIAVYGSLWGAYVEARGNIIAFNGAEGINADSGLSLGNSIYSNGGPGLDLDNALGPPALESASRTDGEVIISGSAQADPGATVKIEAFSNDSCDASGSGEGQRLVAAVTLTTDSSGSVDFSINTNAPLHRAKYITAALTTGLGGGSYTSDFSNCLPVSITH